MEAGANVIRTTACNKCDKLLALATPRPPIRKVVANQSWRTGYVTTFRFGRDRSRIAFGYHWRRKRHRSGNFPGEGDEEGPALRRSNRFRRVHEGRDAPDGRR